MCPQSKCPSIISSLLRDPCKYGQHRFFYVKLPQKGSVRCGEAQWSVCVDAHKSAELNFVVLFRRLILYVLYCKSSTLQLQ